MLKNAVERRLGVVASFGSSAVTLLVTDRISTEPVNVGKMVLLVVISFASFSLILPNFRKNLIGSEILLAAGAVFLFFGSLSIFLSSNSWVKGFYGTFGRNTGLLTYLSLFLILFAFSLNRREQSFKLLVGALYFTGSINILISIIDLIGGRVFTWDNPYKNILGTFGNTNFISSFMGIFISALAAYVLKPCISMIQRVIVSLTIILGAYITFETRSLQGLVLIALGVAIVIYFYIVSKYKKTLYNLLYALFLISLGVIGVLGTLQIGPLKEFLYKPSVSFRGEYWAAGIRMGFDNLFHGVGFDSFGTFYRLYRDSSAIVSPGVKVVTDTSHNVFIDIFAGIGIFGFLAYLTIIFLVLRAAYKVIRNKKSYDFLFVAMFTAWCCYQIQSIISINQIGLAIWGWILGGAIIGYSNIGIQQRAETPTEVKSKKINLKIDQPESISASAVLLLVLSLSLGLVISIPPFVVDAKVRTSFVSSKGEKVIEAAKSWPLDSFRLNKAAVALANSGLNGPALDLAQKSVESFPDDYLGWFVLYQLTPKSDENWIVYQKKLHEIDPLNPEFAGSN